MRFWHAYETKPILRRILANASLTLVQLHNVNYVWNHLVILEWHLLSFTFWHLTMFLAKLAAPLLNPLFPIIFSSSGWLSGFNKCKHGRKMSESTTMCMLMDMILSALVQVWEARTRKSKISTLSDAPLVMRRSVLALRNSAYRREEIWMKRLN